MARQNSRAWKVLRRAQRQFRKELAAARMPYSGLIQRDAGQPWPRTHGTFATRPIVRLPFWLMLLMQEARNA